MAYEEYENLRFRANNSNTKYVLYTLDGVGKERTFMADFVNKTIALMVEMQKQFLQIEKVTNKKILVRNKIVELSNYNKKTINKNKFLCNYNPNFSSGDLLSFSFYKENITDKIFFEVFYKSAKKVDNIYTYHFAKQNYETNNYVKGNNLYWVGYAQQFLNSKEGKTIRQCDLNIKNLKETKSMKTLNQNEFRELITNYFKTQGKNYWFDFLTYVDKTSGESYHIPCLIDENVFNGHSYFKVFCEEHTLPKHLENRPMDYIKNNLPEGITMLNKKELENIINSCGYKNAKFENMERNTFGSGEMFYTVSLKEKVKTAEETL